MIPLESFVSRAAAEDRGTHDDAHWCRALFFDVFMSLSFSTVFINE